MPTPFILGSKQANIPSGYHELTLGQFVELSTLTDLQDVCLILQALTGVSAQDWNDAELNALNIALLNNALIWLHEKAGFDKWPVPDNITINGKACEVPKRIEIKTLGQKAAFDRYITNEVSVDGGQTILTPRHMVKAIAIYMQPEYTGQKFNPDELDKMEGYVKGLSVMEAVPLATFFLRKLLNLKSVRIKLSTPKMKNRKSPVLNGSPVLER
jgi:hypothetical protein